MLNVDSGEEVILKIENVNKSFSGVRVLNDICFELRKGEVHALIWENGAGKSTLMNILLGIIPADSGTIIYKGKRVKFDKPNDALKAGISMIHQEISLISNMTIAENIWIGREKSFTKGGLIDKKALIDKTAELLRQMNINLNPSTVVADLSVANMQMVELARAASYNSEVIVMDEPTSALTQTEVEILYSVVRGMSEKGASIIFISHKLNEILDICNRVTVLRDGRYIATNDCSKIDVNTLIKLIVGRELANVYPEKKNAPGEVLFEVKGLSCGHVFENVDFYARSGEIVGFCGLMGAGRTEIMRGLFGIDARDSGSFTLNGKAISIRSPEEAIRGGIGMITEDRQKTGAIRMLSVKYNMTLMKLYDLIKARFFIKKKEESKICVDMINRMSIKASSENQIIGHLSGGNQQKAIIGKWLMLNPKVLIMDEPTRGIDVGSKYEIYSHIISMAERGMAIIMISSELPEILGMSDRIYVVRHGKIVAEHVNRGITQEQLIAEEFGA